jgi:uncharacterized protein YxjI
MEQMISSSALLSSSSLVIRQKRELAELLGFESRNKYEIMNEQGSVLGYAAEQNKGFLGMLFRQFLGHWRRFEVFIFDNQKQQIAIAKQPFRFFFQRLEIRLPNDQPIGALQQRFAIFRKRFDIVDADGKLIFEMSSPFFRIWTFKFFDLSGTEIARIEKKWSGLFSEVFTDRDNFRLQFGSPGLSGKHRYLLIAAAIFIDLNYFEKKA